MKPFDPNDAPKGDIACLPGTREMREGLSDCKSCKYYQSEQCPTKLNGLLWCVWVNRADCRSCIFKDRG